MKVITIMNLKGGVGKSITSINVSHILATMFHKKILIIDNDKQGNTSKFFGLYDQEKPSISDVLLGSKSIENVIKHTAYEGLDVLPSNMKLFETNNMLAAKMSIGTAKILKRALSKLMNDNSYDYCIIDNPPDINASVTNVLSASDEIIVPVVVDQFSFDGFDQLKGIIEEVKEINPKLVFSGCLITRYNKTENEIISDQNIEDYKIFNTRIRYSSKVAGSTFVRRPLINYSRRSGATMDYITFTKEYFNL
jgi:chromosome partitioning protein